MAGMAESEGFASEIDRLSKELARAGSFEELPQRAVQACATAVRAEICTLWTVYRDEIEGGRLRLAAAFGVSAPQTLAQEITYRITPGAGTYDGVTGYVVFSPANSYLTALARISSAVFTHLNGRASSFQLRMKACRR